MLSTRALFAPAPVLLVALLAPSAPAAEALRQHPANPRCFLFRGRPAVLVGSTEHYGAVLNPDFEWRRYLDTIGADGLDLVRIFSGAYFEKSGDFGIRDNTLAPAPGRALVPWARSTTPGARGGGNLWDLDRWDPAYFERLRGFVEEASRRSIVVEVALFSSNYSGWSMSPFHADNNVNGLRALDKRKVHTLDNGPLLARQEALVRRMVAELAPFDNVYYEVQNEPYADLPETADVTNPYLLAAEVAKDWLFWKNGTAFSFVLRKISEAPPCQSLAPDLVVNITTAPEFRPYSAFMAPVTTRNSESALGEIVVTESGTLIARSLESPPSSM